MSDQKSIIGDKLDEIRDLLSIEQKANVETDLIDCAWYVGATGNNEDGVYTDFSDQYIEEGRWENGWDTKFTDLVKEIRPGDRIALKASYTKKRGLPFENNGKTVSVMSIKAIGIVTENLGDGKNIKVEWTKVDPVKEWFGAGVLRTTLHLVKASDGFIKQQLLKFTFNGGLQDYALCEEQYNLNDEIEETSEILETDPEEAPEEYKKANFLNEVFMDSDRYDELVKLLKYKKNIILQGAPGVGKTFLAKRLAYSIIGKKSNKQVETIQFHQSYCYEDFIMGYKPVEDGFELQMGVFYRFCKKAEADPDNDYFFIIDEINRGNLSKIFGELLMLVEGDKRGPENAMKLAYKDEYFFVPPRVYIIGMMNTADRSLAMMDYALRRRFSFFEVEPAFGNAAFTKHVEDITGSKDIAKKVNKKFKQLNEKIADEDTSGLGKGFCIGHSYFCVPPVAGQTAEEWYKAIVNYEISPLLDEYWWDDKNKAKDCREELLND